MKESKQDEFFVKEYLAMQSIFPLDTLGDLKIQEVFIEKKWRSNSDLSKSTISGYQIILKLAGEMPYSHQFDWLCKLENGNPFSAYEHLLVTDIENYQFKDTIIVQVYRGDVFYLDSLMDPLYEFQLVNK